MPSSRTPDEKLSLFLARVEEMFGTRLVRTGGLEASFSINWDRTSTRFSVSSPDPDDLRSFLMSYRHFIAPKEDVFVNLIQDILWDAFDAANGLRTELDRARTHWDRQCKQGMMALSIDGQPFPPRMLQDLWINGVYFHSDERKRATLERLAALPMLLVTHGFLDQLVAGTNYVGFLRLVILQGRSDGTLQV